MKTIKIRGRTLNRNGLPLICVSLVARTSAELMIELAVILPKNPDVIEWRVDFFDDIHDAPRVVATARAIREAIADTLVKPIPPIIFTRRASHEGGEAIAITMTEDAVVALYEAVCASGAVDFIDYELSQSPAHLAKLREVSRVHDVAMIVSYHNFNNTPTKAMLADKFAEAEAQGADVVKVAVMPQQMSDVLALLEATLTASQMMQIPIITMSMGAMGAMTRLCGHLYGSALTFAVGQTASAPGQIPVDELRAVLTTLSRTDRQK